MLSFGVYLYFGACILVFGTDRNGVVVTGHCNFLGTASQGNAAVNRSYR